jgi:CheY-like chemotaxis protein
MPKVLIIDDDKDFQSTTSTILTSGGFETVSAYNAEEGKEKVISENPELVILDVMMPNDYEGFELARIIREDLKMRDLPIILLTAVHTAKKVPYRFGPDEHYLPVDYFYDKPVEPGVLLQKVKELLNIVD